MRRRIDRRGFILASAAGAAGAMVPGRALAGHWPGGDGNTPPGHTPGEGPQLDEGDLPSPTTLPPRPEPTLAQDFDRGDAVITRFQWNLEASNFGCWGDHRTGLVYVSQRLTDRVVVFDRHQEKFVAIHYIPTDGSGAHAIRVDERNNRVWYAAGEASKIGALVLDPSTLTPRNFVEYTVPGDVRVERKPHGLVSVRRRVWYTDDRQDRVGFLDVATGVITVIDRKVEADGINYEQRRRRIWVAGGSTVTVIDERSGRIEHEIPVPPEPGVSQFRLHDLHYDRRFDRVWVLSRGSDHVFWIDAAHPEQGPRAYVNPGETAAGLDHVDLGHHVWWTEGRSNRVTRHNPYTGETRAYEVPAPLGYFNPHGIFVSTRWNEVWFTEREALCRLRLKGGAPV